MSRILFAVCVLSIAAGLPDFEVASAQPTTGRPSSERPSSGQPAGIVFKAADNTGLREILIRRRAELEKRQGGPLKGHAWWLWGLGSFDYDRDGDVDLMVCIHGSTNGVILRNQLIETGKLAFVDVTKELGVDGFVPSTDNYPLMWDFNGDGYLDVAGLLDDTKTPCLLNQGGKRFTKASFTLHPINYPDEIRDLNGDGAVDIAQERHGKRIQFLYDAKSATFTKSESPVDLPVQLPASFRDEMEKIRSKEGNRYVKFKFFRRDLDGDGQLDLVVRAFGSYSGDRLGWYMIADDRGKLTDRTKELALPRGGAPFLIEDIDHDGDIDVLISSGEEAGLFLNDGAGKFARRDGPLTEFVRQRCPYLHVVMRVDFDHDGDLDIAVSNRRYGREKVFENRGKGDFAPVLSVRGWDADPLVLRDINNDNLVDVIVGGAEEKENIGIYLNATPQTGNFCRLFLRMNKPNVYAVGTRVEYFRSGALGEKDARPLLAEEAHLDGSPIHLGLGEATSFDLRVTFPGNKVLQLKNVNAEPEMFVTPDGLSNVEPK